MRTYEEIENRREELENLISESGITEEIDREWKALHDEEMQLEMMDTAIAICQNGEVKAFVRDMYECGWAVNTNANGKWDYDEHSSILDAMKAFAKFARDNGIKTCHVDPYYLDLDHLREIDRKAAAYRDQEAYADACMLSEYGDDSLLNRYYRNHEMD